MPRQQPWTFCSKCNHQVYDWDKYCPLCFSPNPYYRYQRSPYDRKEVGAARSNSYYIPLRKASYKSPADKKRKEKEDNKCCIIMLVIFAILCILGKLFSVH